VDRYDVVVVGGGAAGLSGAVRWHGRGAACSWSTRGSPATPRPTGCTTCWGRRVGRPPSCSRPGATSSAVRRRRSARRPPSRPRGTDGASPSSSPTAAPCTPGAARGHRARRRAAGRCRAWPSCGAPTSCTAPTATAGRPATPPSACSRPARWRARRLLWRQLTDDLTVFVTRPGLLSADDLERLAARDIAVVDGEVTALETTDGRLSGVRLADGRVVAAPGRGRGAALHRPVRGPGRPRARAGGAAHGRHRPRHRRPDRARRRHRRPRRLRRRQRRRPARPGRELRAQGLMAGARINAELVEQETALAVQRRTERRSA
jgi:hypothetical protein